MYEYWYLVVVFLLVTLFAYIKIRHPFWNIQPVFHSYDFWRYWSRVPFHIQHGFALKTKYTDLEHVVTHSFLDMDKNQKAKMVDLLQCHYILSDRVLTVIDATTIESYLTGHSHPAYVSFYQEPHYEIVQDLSGSLSNLINAPSSELLQASALIPGNLANIQNIPSSIGCMSSRPIRLFVCDKSNHLMDQMAYYWDHICVHRNYQAKHISRQIIQTHEYRQRQEMGEIAVSIFRKEEILCEGIVPLVKFRLYTFYLRNIRMPPLPPYFTVIRIFGENIDVLSDFLFGISHPREISKEKSIALPLFSLCAFPEIGSLVALIKNNLWYVYAIKKGDHIYGIYFLKDAKTAYEDVDGGNLLECVSSISNMTNSIETNGLFFAGFLHALKGIMGLKSKIYRMLAFSDLGHNGRILERWKWKYSAVFENTAAYYAYNMVVPGMPLAKERCMVLL